MGYRVPDPQEELLKALKIIAGMNAEDQMHYFKNDEGFDIKSSVDGLYQIVLGIDDPGVIVDKAYQYWEEKHKAQMQAYRMEVKELSDRIGMRNLARFVNELIKEETGY